MSEKSKTASYVPPKNLIFTSRGSFEEDRERYVKERLIHYGVLANIVRNPELERNLVNLDRFFNIVDEFTKVFEKS